MDPNILIFLSSGLFLGWSLGANDAANVFGTAVGSRMVRFGTAALICSVCLTLGAVIGGAGAAHGLGKLGQIATLPGAFTVALSAAITVLWMTRAGLPVSTSQAIVGAIIGWNLFAKVSTDTAVLTKISLTWIACPILGAVFAMLLYQLLKGGIYLFKPHLLRQDQLTRYGLIVAGALGSYSLGANNIGNVMGVFVPSSPFTEITLYGSWTLTSTQQLFLLGAAAISVGVFTYSKKVMLTVGDSLMPLTPVAALVVVVAHSMVLFVFSSTWLRDTLAGWGLFRIPLIPVSSSQAVIGAVIGIGLLKGLKGVRQIRWMVLLHIAGGWVMTPIAAAIMCYVCLFIMQNVFNQVVM
jgi:PiT family inorganic phosphate transporter